jgi:hypothetical protein
MTSCVITDKRSHRIRKFLLPKSFFPARVPARVAKLGKDLSVRKRQAPRVARRTRPSVRREQESYSWKHGWKLSAPRQRGTAALHVKSNDDALW